jgi:hypothetical protein
VCPDTQVTIGETAYDGHYLRLRYHDVDIVVCSADGDSLDWLEAFLQPSFETVGPAEIWRDDVAGSRRQVEHRVGYVVDRRRFAKLRRDIEERSTGSRSCFVLDSEVVRLPAVQHEERTWLLDEENGCVLIVGPGSIEIVANPAAPRQRLPLLRAVREIAAEGWRRHGGHLQLHAAALAVGGEVVLFAGEKNAGKTTLLMHALGAPGARLVANDRVAIRLEKDHAVARGMPTIVSIRSGTLERFPKLLVGLPTSPYPWSLTDAEWRVERNAVGPSPKRDHLRLSPPRFAAQLGCHVVAGGRVEAIFVCSLDSTQATRSLMPLRQSEARAALAACLYGRSASRVEPTIIEALVKGPAPADVATSLDALAARVKVFECRLGPDAYVEPFAFPSTAVRRDAGTQ